MKSVDINIEGKPLYEHSYDELKQLYSALFNAVRKLSIGKKFKNTGYLYRNGQVKKIPFTFGDDETKAIMIEATRVACHEQKVQKIICVMDAWIVRPDPKEIPRGDIDEYINSEKFIRPKDHPERKDCLFGMLYLPDGRCDVVNLVYEIDSDGKAIFEKTAKWFKGDRFDVNLFRPWKLKD